MSCSGGRGRGGAASACKPCRTGRFTAPCGIETRFQSVIGSGPSPPPTTEFGPSDLNVRYAYWLQTAGHNEGEAFVFYGLQRSVESVPLRYLALERGSDDAVRQYVSQRFFLTDQANVAAINQSRSFIYAPPPVPAVRANLVPNNRYTLTPDYWLTPPAQKFTVFIRDRRNGRYFRDPNNRNTDPPAFMLNLNACDGDVGEDANTNLRYVFDGATAKWYVDDYIDTPAFIKDDVWPCALNNIDADSAAEALSYDNDAILPVLPDPANFTEAQCAKAACCK